MSDLLSELNREGLKLINPAENIHVLMAEGVTGPQAISLTKEDIRALYEHTHQTVTRHRMTSGLADILVNMAKTVHEKNRNDIHIYTEIAEVCGAQSYSHLSNITKLRFHALVFKITGEDGKQIKGRWGITRRGGQFLRGEIEIPEFALTKGNHVEGREGKLVRIHAVRPEGPVEFEQREDITYTNFNADERGQGKLL